MSGDTIATCLTAAIDLKQQGNAFYGQGKHSEAIAKYKEGIDTLLPLLLLPLYDKEASVVDNFPTVMLDKGGIGFDLSETKRLAHSVASHVASLVPPPPLSVATAAAAEKEGRDLTATATAINKDVAVLYSNASQCLLDAKRFAAAAASAERAMFHDPTLTKAIVRRIRALCAAGNNSSNSKNTNTTTATSSRCFEAFILYYLHIAPLISSTSTSNNKQEYADLIKLVSDLADVVGDGVGVTGVHAGLGLRMTMHASDDDGSTTTTTANTTAGKNFDGGLSTIATMPIAADAVIFTEKQYTHPQLNASPPTTNGGEELSSEALIKHFSRQLVASMAAGGSASPASSSSSLLFSTFAATMRGSWPRSLEEISQPLANHFLTELRAFHAKDIREGLVIDDTSASGKAKKQSSGDSNEKNNNSSSTKKASASIKLTELTHLAVACRYNCFHSGFFRTCALANHSCNPNAAMKYVAAQQKVVMVAVRPIAVGEDITVKYLPDLEYIMGVSRRRELLFRSWLFWCDCKRCASDLTNDNGSNSCKQEWVKCQSCKDINNGYAHYAKTGLNGHSSSASAATANDATAAVAVDADGSRVDLADPAIPSASTCNGCGAAVSLTKEDALTLFKSVDAFLRRVRGEDENGRPLKGAAADLSLLGLSEALLASYTKASLYVHEDHWTHRVQLYTYCLVIGGVIDNTFGYLTSRQMGAVSCGEAVLFSFGLAKAMVANTAAAAAPQRCDGDEAGGDASPSPFPSSSSSSSHFPLSVIAKGGDLLVALLELWRRIESFYPPSQAWQLHVMIVKLLIISLLQPSGGKSSLDHETASEILIHHAPFLPVTERRQYLRTLLQLKDFDKDAIMWSPKVHKNMKKAFA